MRITDYIKDHTILLDGGMGTLLQARGLQPGEKPERWNISHPQDVIAIHSAYYNAGSNVVISNTFGANTLKFSSEELESIVSAAISNVRRAAEESHSSQPKWAALDIGPLGRLLKPYGDLDFEEAVSVFAQTVKLGEKYGADLIFIETMNDSYETKAALLAAKENSSLPVFVSNAYGADGKLMTGASPLAMIAMLEGMGADAIGVNCSLGPKALYSVVEEYLRYASVPVIFKPNAGLPKVIDGKTVYDLDPEHFAAETAALAEKGARALGGCCGTTPDYISALSDRVKSLSPLPLTEKNITVISSYTHAVAFGDRPVLIGERINPTGKKHLQEALRSGDISFVLHEADCQQANGAAVLDINVGLPGLDEVSLLPRICKEVQAVCDLPLQIDSSDPAALEAALRAYNGKPMVNSVNGKKSSMSTIFPLVRKYGGLVVALTLDENGIPSTAEGRLRIAESILCEAEKHGIKKKDIIFDPLAMTVSADNNAALETLRAVSMIHDRLGARSVLGISNVSFGLPHRDTVNSTFFTLAVSRGLSAAIINPQSEELIKAYHTVCVLNGQDAGCEEYIRYSLTMSEEQKHVVPESSSGLKNAVIRGFKEQAATLTRESLTHNDAQTIIEHDIIPALDTVGVRYEQQELFLPQMLMSAEAAKASFDVIKERAGETDKGKGKIILAAVRGDIHDIGKNIVKLLLENYGYDVIDLGKDVPPETVAEKAHELGVSLVGLSALMTTTVPAMEETIRLLRKKVPDCKVVVGGAVLHAELASAIGADRYARDAMETVRYAEEVLR